jgi:Fe2+ or Zn2+ uptake regulation protein
MKTIHENLEKLREWLPKRSNYAKEIVQRLAQKSVTVSPQQVYRTVQGKMYHREIVDEFIQLADEYKTHQEQQASRVNELIN